MRTRAGAAWVALSVVAGCKQPSPAPAPDAGREVQSPATIAATLTAIARAEDQRLARALPAGVAEHREPVVRRRAARALARIADDASVPGLMAALSDADREVMAWGAYGLGRACEGQRGHEDAHVRALAARAASLDVGAPADAGRARRSKWDAAAIDATESIVRAIGRCGGVQAEELLADWVRASGPSSEDAAFALGDIASRQKELRASTVSALLAAAAPGRSSPPPAAALFPFGRLDRAPDSAAESIQKAARAALAQPNAERLFAVRALGRAGAGGIADLIDVAVSAKYLPAERAEAARALAQIGPAGKLAALDAVARFAPAPGSPAPWGDDFGVVSALLRAAGGEVSKRVEPALYALAGLAAPDGASPAVLRRVAAIRCGAAGLLARGAYDADVLAKCSADGSEPLERARLAALVSRPLTGPRRVAWRDLTKSAHVRVRESALEAIGTHPELGDFARAALIEALESGAAGLVATAADVVHAHPDPGVAAALQTALAHAWTPDLVETRIALLDAAVAVSLPNAKPLAQAACRDPNVTMRDRAARALRAIGEADAACPAPQGGEALAPEAENPISKPTKVVFKTDAGDFPITFDPALTPVAASRFVALARAGFYDGIVIHRVVPGFVVQFGDPGGDGYGGSGSSLRCETSPVPFGPLDVGVALAGRDTGSSQIFVTLARYPNLDGEYARVGKAEGDWRKLAEGDVIHHVQVID